jgi:hypothetical protein
MMTPNEVIKLGNLAAFIAAAAHHSNIKLRVSAQGRIVIPSDKDERNALKKAIEDYYGNE